MLLQAKVLEHPKDRGWVYLQTDDALYETCLSGLKRILGETPEVGGLISVYDLEEPSVGGKENGSPFSVRVSELACGGLLAHYCSGHRGNPNGELTLGHAGLLAAYLELDKTYRLWMTYQEER